MIAMPFCLEMREAVHAASIEQWVKMFPGLACSSALHAARLFGVAMVVTVMTMLQENACFVKTLEP